GPAGKISYATATRVREAIVGRGAILDTIIEGPLAEADVDRSTIFGGADYGERLAIRVGVELRATVVTSAIVKLEAGVVVTVGATRVVLAAVVMYAKELLLEEIDGPVTVTNMVLKLAGYVGIKLVEMEELEFPEGLGRPEVAPVELVAFVNGSGRPDVGREDTVRFTDGVGNPDDMIVGLVKFTDGIGIPEVGREVILELIDGLGKPEDASLRLGTEKLVISRVGAMVGRVPDEAKVLERDREVLKPRIDGEKLELRDPTMLEPVPSADVVEGGTGVTKMVDEVVVGAGGLPWRLVGIIIVANAPFVNSLFPSNDILETFGSELAALLTEDTNT
ncbi:MAG: hypothetical protein Q9172_003868, partial [Xanthocarpia lactea]